MEPHDSRDLDGVIDGVARALTSPELSHDLRPVVASRIASGSSSMFGWRAGLAAVAIATVVLAAVVLRPRPATVPSRTAVAERSTPAVERPAAAPLVATHDEAPTPPVVRRARAAVRRQIGGDGPASQSVVEIEPVAIVPLREDRPTARTQARIEIAPIDVEPVRIHELGDAAE